MRELMRSMAKSNMKEAGFTKMFKKHQYKDGDTVHVQSVFGRNWRNYIFSKKKR